LLHFCEQQKRFDVHGCPLAAQLTAPQSPLKHSCEQHSVLAPHGELFGLQFVPQNPFEHCAPQHCLFSAHGCPSGEQHVPLLQCAEQQPLSMEHPSPFGAQPPEPPEPEVAAPELPVLALAVLDPPEPVPVAAEPPEPELVVAEPPGPVLAVAEPPEPAVVVAEPPEPAVVVAEPPEPAAVVAEPFVVAAEALLPPPEPPIPPASGCPDAPKSEPSWLPHPGTIRFPRATVADMPARRIPQCHCLAIRLFISGLPQKNSISEPATGTIHNGSGARNIRSVRV
jgi:hypothetical protein